MFIDLGYWLGSSICLQTPEESVAISQTGIAFELLKDDWAVVADKLCIVDAGELFQESAAVVQLLTGQVLKKAVVCLSGNTVTCIRSR